MTDIAAHVYRYHHLAAMQQQAFDWALTVCSLFSKRVLSNAGSHMLWQMAQLIRCRQQCLSHRGNFSWVRNY